MFSKKTINNQGVYHDAFKMADPFPFVCMDEFLDAEAITALNKSFPSEKDPNYFDFCVEDGGNRGSNYANPEPQTFPEAFKRLDKFLSSRELIKYLETVTGIKGLQYDPEYQGGGLRESKKRGFLPVHLDFNRHPKTGYHRRLNLLLYLNEGWKEEWGGHIQAHRDPRQFTNDSLVKGFSPINNRCFIFETSEHSWHGFSKLDCPDGQGRKAVSIYYFTETRPEGDVPFRNTEYVEPPLPVDIKAGYRLTVEDEELIKTFLKRRDDRIQMLYELRRGADGKYTHLWSEYEYYLDKFKKYQEKYGDI